jgi:predicted AlkP superfamily pyrophosphatase or phosphodiesterase
MRRTLRVLFFVSLIAEGLFAASPAPHKKPKLVLAIIVDQFRYDYLLRFREDYHAGLARLLEQGAVFTDAHYLQSATVTSIGHSTFLSGAPPSISGIIANEWYDRESGKSVSSVFDPRQKTVGGVPDAIGSSPRRLLVSTVVDELKMRFPESHAIGISIKDRSAILPAGRMADAAYWYDNDSNNWVTSTYYRSDLPEWVQTLNAKRSYQSHIGAEWHPVDSGNDATAAFCTTVAGSPTRYCGGLEATPWGNEMIEDFAERAIDEEQLGRHQGVDVLAVSFSSNDYIGHQVGPDDPAIRDISIRTDRLLGRLLAHADQAAGEGSTLVVFTSDHGVAPLPELNQSRNMPGGRLVEFRLTKRITDALTKRFGPGEWLLPGSPVTMPYLNLSLIHRRGLDPAQLERVAADAAAGEDHIARVYTRRDLLSGNVQHDSLGQAMSLGFYGPRSGDLLILPEPYYVFETTGTGHGTPYGYDTHVPVIFLGPDVKAGLYRQRIAVNDIAPTLSTLLEVETPSGSMGRILTEMLP